MRRFEVLHDWVCRGCRPGSTCRSRAEQDLLARVGGVAVGATTPYFADGVLDLAVGDLREVEVARLELGVGRIRVLEDHEVDAVDVGLLAVVVLVRDDLDVLVALPRLRHLERAVADRHVAEGDLLALIVDAALDVLLRNRAQAPGAPTTYAKSANGYFSVT